MTVTQRKRVRDNQVEEYLNCPQRVLKWDCVIGGARELNMLLAGVLRRLRTSKKHLSTSILNRLVYKTVAFENQKKLQDVNVENVVECFRELLNVQLGGGGSLPVITLGALEIQGLLGYITNTDGFTRIIMPIEILAVEPNRFSPTIMVRAAAAYSLDINNISEITGCYIDKGVMHTYSIPLGREVMRHCLRFTDELVENLKLYKENEFNKFYCSYCRYSPDNERGIPCLNIG